MQDDWGNKEDRERTGHLAMEIQDHADHLLELALPFHQKERVLHIHHAAQALLAMVCHTPGDPPYAMPPCPDSLNDDENRPAQNGTGESTGGVEKEEAARSLAHLAIPSSPSLNILLVEDNPFTQKLMTRLLALRHHRVTVVKHGKEALELLTSASAQGATETRQGAMFDLILMDIRMPVMDGLKATAAIRHWEKAQQTGSTERARVPILAVTALSSDADRSRALHAGMDGFHGKPIQANRLFTEINRLISMTFSPPQEQPKGKAGAIPDTGEDNVKVVLDIRQLLKTVENDWTLLKEIFDLYRTDAPKKILIIRQGIEEADPDKVLEAAHALKGSSAAFGDTLVYDLAFKLEQAGRSRKMDQAADTLTQLQRAMTSLESALQDELAKHGIL